MQNTAWDPVYQHNIIGDKTVRRRAHRLRVQDLCDICPREGLLLINISFDFLRKGPPANI